MEATPHERQADKARATPFLPKEVSYYFSSMLHAFQSWKRDSLEFDLLPATRFVA